MAEAGHGSDASSTDISCRCPSGEWISKYRSSPNSTVPPDILQFDYSFGYNAKKLFNLCLLTPNILVFGSGNILHFFNIRTNEMTFRRSALGGGIGYVTKNPNPKYNYLTVAENGIRPPIILYSYPNLEIVHVLNDGAKRCFTHMDYSRDGELLAAQAGDPDYLLTIFDWQKDQIVLRAQSFQNDVLNVMFSPYNPTQLTSCGLGHIKFWKMNETFTGLKLQGELGRFGKTEICDIYAIYPLPDEKVISGCDWGNMLLWDAGLIKLEVCRKNRKPCHTAPITQISMMDGEVMTVGMDGYVRVWFWETVDLADPPEDDRFVEIEPIYEFSIGSKDHQCELRNLIKKEPDKPKDYKFFAQDGAGGIWICDLNPEKSASPPQQLYFCHSGAVVAIAPSPNSTHIVTLDESGRMHLYNYMTRKLLATKDNPANGRDLLWLSPAIEPSGAVLIGAFEDGVIRTILADTNEKGPRFCLIDAIKSHSKGITRISTNAKQTVLASASEDLTVFIHQLLSTSPFVRVIPIGFYTMESIPVAINWHIYRPSTVVIGCDNGYVAEIDAPERPRSYTEESYSLDHTFRHEFRFASVKSQIRRQLQIDAINRKKQEKRERKLDDLKRMQAENPNIDLDIYLEDSDSEEELQPLFVPKIPNRILWLQYTPDQTIWLSMSGYDAGYIYECAFEANRTGLVKSTLIYDADDVEIHSYLKLNSYTLFGMQNGSIRIVKDYHDFRALFDYWELTMHDNYNGTINRIVASSNQRYIFSIGNDGNIFCYKWNGPTSQIPTYTTVKFIIPKQPIDIDDRNILSLEEQKQKDVNDNSMYLANERKAKTLDILSEYKLNFKEILKKNRALPISQQFTYEELEVDPRITADIIEGLNEQLQLVRRKMAFDVEKASLAKNKVLKHFIQPLQNLRIEISGIRSDTVIRSFRIEKLDENYYKLEADVETMIQERKDKKWDIQYFEEDMGPDIQAARPSTESFLQGLTTSTIELKLGPKMKRLLDKYRSRKAEERTRLAERAQIESQRPDPNQNHPDDTKAIEEAKRTIGDYKLKTNPTYEPDESQNTLQKYKEIIAIRKELFQLQNEYNLRLFQLRDEKDLLYKYFAVKIEELKALHEHIPEKHRKHILPLPEISIDLEYPEKVLHVERQKQSAFDMLQEGLAKHHKTHHTAIELTEKEQRNTRLSWQLLALNPNNDFYNFEATTAITDSHPKPQAEHNLDEVARHQLASHLSAWQKELAFNRTLNIISEQDLIIYDVDYKINKFDEKLEKLFEERLQIETDTKYLELFLVTLNQELYILRDFERVEDGLVQQVENSVQNRNEMQTNIIRVKNANEEHRKSIEKMLEQEKTIQNRFLTDIKNNKFADFLRRIFKKKYKPPKETNVDDSDESTASSESSSSEEEDDSKSIDSLDIAPVRLDENYCPPGCDQGLYDLTFQLRAERHLLEQKVYEVHKTIETAKKQIDDLNSKMKLIEIELTANRDTLMGFRREKQSYLNKVETIIVVKMNQMQYFKEEKDFLDIDSALLFNMPSVTKLYTRVGQLYEETEEAKQKHRINIVHLSRMKADCRYMENRIHRFKTEVDQAMIKKFGRIVNLDELEESVLRRFVFNMRINIVDEKQEAERKIIQQKEKLALLETDLIKETQAGTEKLNILTILQEEKNYLGLILQKQNKRLDKLTTGGTEKQIDFRHDLNKLKDIEKQQQEQIEYLEKEIRSLRLKAKPFLCPDEQKPEMPAYGATVPGRDELCYEEYVYMAVHESAKDEAGPIVNPKVDIYEKVNIAVGRLLIKALSTHSDDNQIRKYSSKIAKHLAYVANNLDRNQSMNATECVVKYIYDTIPAKLHTYLKDIDFRALFYDVISIVQDKHLPINTADIMAEIIENAVEQTMRIQTINMTHDIISKILKDMIEFVPVTEICSSAVIEQIADAISQLDEIDFKCLNFVRLSDEAIQHAKENMNDDITMTVVKRFTDSLISSLKIKIGSRRHSLF